jgi:GAF domain-containing protein
MSGEKAMSSWLKRLFTWPVFEDEETTRNARLGITLALVHLIMMTLVAVIEVAAGIPNFMVVVYLAGFGAVIDTAVIFMIRAGRMRVAIWLWTFLNWLTVMVVTIFTAGMDGIGVYGYTVVVALAGVLLGRNGGFLFAGLSAAAGLGLVWAQNNNLLPASIAPAEPFSKWSGLVAYLVFIAALVQFATGGLGKALDRARRSEQSLTESNLELEASRGALQVRTRDLERQTTYLKASAEVSRVATSILKPEEMIRQVAELIREQFGLYYVGLFMLDEAGGDGGERWATLQSGTGEAGRVMLARRHRIKVGEGMIGRSIAEAKVEVAQEAREAPGRLATPELPETRSEAAIPLRSPDGVLGAITVQHTEPDAFDPDTLAVLQTMADQLAVALVNVRLMAESQAALEVERRAYGEISQRAWQQLTRVSSGSGYVCDRRQVRAVKGELPLEMTDAGRSGKMVQTDGLTVALPVKVRGQVIAVMRLSKPQDGSGWTAEEVALVEALADQLNLAMDSARLYQETQRRATQERLIGDITARMRETFDVDAVLQTAVREMGEALGLHDLTIQLELDQDRND